VASLYHNSDDNHGHGKDSPAKTPAKRRGRPPSPGGPKSPAEIQRAYRARLAAAGKVVKLIDPTAILDPAVYEEMRDRLHNALLKLELRQQDVTRLEARNAYLEAELKQVERHHTNALKDNIVLKKQLAEQRKRRARQAEASDIP
jgi:hypothetical protein